MDFRLGMKMLDWSNGFEYFLLEMQVFDRLKCFLLPVRLEEFMLDAFCFVGAFPAVGSFFAKVCLDQQTKRAKYLGEFLKPSKTSQWSFFLPSKIQILSYSII